MSVSSKMARKLSSSMPGSTTDCGGSLAWAAMATTASAIRRMMRRGIVAESYSVRTMRGEAHRFRMWRSGSLDLNLNPDGTQSGSSRGLWVGCGHTITRCLLWH